MADLQNLKLVTNDGKLIFSFVVGDASITNHLQVTLLLHDEVTIGFFAGFGASRVNDYWQGEMKWSSAEAPRVFTLNISVANPEQEPAQASQVIVLEPEDDGEWILGEPAEAEAERLAHARDSQFKIDLEAPNAELGSPTFSVVMLADNLFLTQQQYVPGIWVIPLQESTLGSDVVNVLNDVLRQRGFENGLWPDKWIEMMRSRRPAVVLLIENLHADDGESAHKYARDEAIKLLDLLALRRGTSPRILGGAVGKRNENGAPSNPGFWIEGSGYTGNLLGGFISGEDQHSLQSQWDSIQGDPRIELWLALYADANGDDRWDYRLFRCFNLLEGIAAETVPKNKTILDAAGNPRLLANGRDPYTTKHARGKVYDLLQSIASKTNQGESNFASQNTQGTSFDLWDEIAVWVDVRNAVAHRGSWTLPAGESKSNKHQEAESDIVARSHSQSFQDGATNLARTIRRALESVLYLALNGEL